MDNNSNQLTVIPADKQKIKKLWTVAGILGFVTAIEFAIAFLAPESWRLFKITIFVALTIVKAYYIVSEFMHLGHEAKGLIMSILIPMGFVVWLLVALLVEGNTILNLF